MTRPSRRAPRARPTGLLPRRLGRGLAGLLGLGLLLSAAAGGVADGASAATPTPTPSPSEAATAPAAEVTVTSVSPHVLKPGQDLVVSATIRNTGDTTLTDPRATLRLSRFLLSTRSSLQGWEQGDTARGTLVGTVTLGAPLDAGGSAGVRITVAAAAVKLSVAPEAWGPRGISVAVDDGGKQLDIDRTFLVWFPTDQVSPTRLSVAVPLTGGPSVLPGATGEPAQSAASLARLDSLVAITADLPAVTWVVDPALLSAVATASVGPDDADADPDGDGDGDGDGNTDAAVEPEARARAVALVAGAAGRDVFTLGWLDPDLGALAHAGATELGATELGASAVALAAGAPLPLLGTPARTDLAWPAAAVPDSATVEFAAQAGARSVIVGGDGLDAPDLTYTPTGRATVPTSAGDVAALVADRALTGFLTEPAQTSAATAAQRMLAETAVVARERPNEPRHVLIAPQRGWKPDRTVARAQLLALAGAPWIEPAPLPTLIGAADPQVERTSLAPEAVDADELAPASVAELSAAKNRLTHFSSIAADPSVLLDGADAAALTPLSVAWRADRSGRATVVGAVISELDARRTGVSVVPGSTLNVLSQSGTFPVGLRNDLDQAVTVRVALTPETRVLVVDKAVTVTIPAASQLQARIPFNAVGSGDVAVVVTLLAPDGLPVSAPTRFTARVRADWENVGTAVVAGVLGLAFVIGIVRTIRRGQTNRRGASQVELARIAEPQDQT